MTARATTTRRRGDRGFTLIELVMATVLAGIVGGVLVAAIATSLRVADSTTNQIADSTDTALISAFLFRDAQAAGATDPTTARVDTSVGVSTSDTSSGWAGCPQSGNLVVRFSWIDRQADSLDPEVVVTYALDDGNLTRRSCEGDAGVDVVLGNNIAAAAAACGPDASCDGLAESVSLTFSGSASANPFTYILTASLRPGAQELPTVEGSSMVPLVVLGGGGDTTPCPVVQLNDNSAIAVVGDAAVAAECGSRPVAGTPGNLVHPTGVTRTLTGLTDPFARLEAPTTTCDASALTLTGEPSATTVHPEHVVISDSVELASGTHVFCAGLEVQGGATVAGSDVFLFVLGGTLTVDPAATVSLAAPVAGPYESTLVWVATSQRVEIGGDGLTRYLGHIYAPTSDILVAGEAPTMLGGAVARRVEFAGDGPVRLGLPVPVITIAPSTLPDGQVDSAYPATTLDADGGRPPYTWSAHDLPPDLVLHADTGILSGTPSEAGTHQAIVTVLDATSAAATLTVDVSIRAALSIAGPELLPDGQVAAAYPTTLVELAGGTDPATWTSTEMPPGLVFDPITGVLSGTPSAAGSFPITVTATDAVSATVSATYTIDVREQLTVATPTLPGGQVGVTYPEIALIAAGGTSPVTWTAAGLPPGLGVSPSGELTGTPSTPGTFTVVVQATDAIAATATISYTVAVAPLLEVGTTSLPGGQVGVGYPATAVAATGGTPPFVWSATGLPNGLTIDHGTGTVAGTPTAAGTSTVVVQVTDATSTTSTASYSIVVDAALTIAGPSTLPGGQVGLAYPSTPISSSGGTLSYTWSATGLPAGLAIDTTTGVIAGSPIAAGSFAVDVTVSDGLSVTVTRRYELSVVGELAISTATLPDGQLDVIYPATALVSTGGQAPNTWSATGLPNGLSIAPATGVITGTPHEVGVSTVVVGLIDAAGATATRSLGLTVTSPVSSCPAAVAGWRGEYFDNRSLSGNPETCRDDPSIDFDWRSGGPPGTGLDDNDFSVRWTRTQEFVAGTYTFEIGSDDGSRLYIDGVLVFDRWRNQGYPSKIPTVERTLTGGEHVIVMEYYERGGNARATLTWTSDAPEDPCDADFIGWKGEYFGNATLTGPAKLCRSDATIDFDWRTGSPSPAIPVDRFSVRWTQVVDFSAGTYTFALGSDDGSRLYIDGVLVLDRWAVQSYPNPVPAIDVSLQAGSHTIVVEYYEHYGDARMMLEWSERSNGVTATPSVAGGHRWYGENRIELGNTSEITAMTVTIVVDRTPGQSYAGMWTNLSNSDVKFSRETTGTSIIYTFDLKSNKTIPPGTRMLVAQTSGNGTLHPTAGDTWSVVTTANGVTNTIAGTF